MGGRLQSPTQTQSPSRCEESFPPAWRSGACAKVVVWLGAGKEASGVETRLESL